MRSETEHLEIQMENLFFAVDGSASALAFVRQYELGFLGAVRFAVDAQNSGSLQHECFRCRDTREEALEDARGDAQKLVTMWVEDRARLDDL